MKGTITKQRDDTYKYRIYFGTIDGHDRRKQKSGFSSRASAEHEMNAVMAQMSQTGDYVVDKKMSLRQLYDEFMEQEGARTRKYSTLIKYDSIIENHLAEYFENNFIYNVTTEKLEKFFNEKCLSYSSEYVNSMYNLLLVLFDYAVRKKYIMKNPMNGIPRPIDDDDADILVYTDQELLKLQKEFDDTIHYTSFMLGLYLGVRSGECYALRWSDIDWVQNTITINKQLQRQDKRWCFTPTKTKNSVRTIKFGKILREYLMKLKKEQEEDQRKLGAKYRCRFDILDLRKRKQVEIMVDDFINRKKDGHYMVPGSQRYAVIMAKICMC